MSAAPSEKSPVEPRDWSRAEVKDGVCTIILILTKVEQLFDTDVPVPSEFVALDSDVLDFFTSTIKKHHKACREFRLIVRLPEQALREVEPYMRTSVDLTLKGYFLAREKRIAERLHEHFQDAWKMFGFGFAFVVFLPAFVQLSACVGQLCFAFGVFCTGIGQLLVSVQKRIVGINNLLVQ